MKISMLVMLAGLCGARAFNYMDYSNLYNGEVHLHQSKISGRLSWHSDDLEWKSWEFLGLKYASAERFQAPKIFDDYDNKQFRGKNGQRKPFDTPGPMCPQLQKRNISVGERLDNVSEDCLYLNIHLPVVNKEHPLLKQEAWPVMVYIHGGDFKGGAGHLLNGTILAKQLDAVVVTINYRLGPFGFLSLDDFNAQGNWGIKDIKIGLKWIQMFIDRFGADPTRITLCGQDSGALLASLLLIDREIKSIVSGIILLGTSPASFAGQYSVRPFGLPQSMTLASTLECSTNTSDELLKCLRNTPEPDLTAAEEKKTTNSSTQSVHWFPSLELDVVPDEPQRRFRSATFEGSILRGMVPTLPSHQQLHSSVFDIKNFSGPSRAVYQSEVRSDDYDLLIHTISGLLHCDMTFAHHDFIATHFLNENDSLLNENKEISKKHVEELVDKIPLIMEYEIFAKQSLDSSKHSNYRIFDLDIDSSSCGYNTEFGVESAVLFGLRMRATNLSEQQVCKKVERQFHNLLANFLRDGNDFGMLLDGIHDHNQPRIYRLQKDFRWHLAEHEYLSETKRLLDKFKEIPCFV
ncbi:neuroligin-2-like [Paramacrobiotus metropolitanus]|uniref:neuroligin-2-like n=1 Tax=Paramacrobiotus metropolitanus TaxID=2943436 RepID=UPI0024462C38|nr:neuroligin-2-like [Paramacrobiotus metropolitanus]